MASPIFVLASLQAKSFARNLDSFKATSGPRPGNQALTRGVSKIWETTYHSSHTSALHNVAALSSCYRQHILRYWQSHLSTLGT